MGQTADIQDNIRALLAREGTTKLDDLLGRTFELTGGSDPRWLGAALMHLDRAGAIRYPTCSDSHNHNSTCTVEAVA